MCPRDDPYHELRDDERILLADPNEKLPFIKIPHRIILTMKYLENQCKGWTIPRWTLETVGKYIDSFDTRRNKTTPRFINPPRVEYRDPSPEQHAPNSDSHRPRISGPRALGDCLAHMPGVTATLGIKAPEEKESESYFNEKIKDKMEKVPAPYRDFIQHLLTKNQKCITSEAQLDEEIRKRVSTLDAMDSMSRQRVLESRRR